MSMIAAVIGRLLLAVMFIVSGLQKIVDPAPDRADARRRPTCPPTSRCRPACSSSSPALLLAIGLMTRLVVDRAGRVRRR